MSDPDVIAPGTVNHSGMVARHFAEPGTPSIKQTKRSNRPPEVKAHGIIVRVFQLTPEGNI